MKPSRLLLSALVCVFSASALHAEDKYRIGASLPLSGDTATWGKACQNGMQMALDELPVELRNKLEIVYEDDSLQPAKTATAFQKLVNSDKVNAFVSYGSGCANVAAPLAEAQRIPHIAVASDERVVRDRKYSFNFWVTPETEASVLVREARALGYKKVARLSTQWEGCVAVNRAVDKAREGVFDIVLDEEVPASTKDFLTVITRLKSRKDLDALFLMLMPGQNGIFTKQLRQLGVTLPLMNIETFEAPDDVKSSEGAMLGLWYVQADDATDDFLRRFMKAFPGSSTNSAGNCHDIVQLIAAAREKGEPLQGFLEQVKGFSGAMGTFSSTSDHRFTLPATTKVVQEGGFRRKAPAGE